MKDSSIFNLRFGSNVDLEPSAQELEQYLKSAKTGTREREGDDLAPYWELMAAVAAYKIGGTESFRDKMLYTVLSHSHFAKPALKSVVEQYKYHFHGLSNIDFKKPTAFIKSAEEEIGRLNPKKKDEASRIERLRTMIEERRQALESAKKRRLVLAEELKHIIAYIGENLVKIVKLCEHSIEALVNEQIDRKKEADLIEDIKRQFKERLRESLHHGTITKQDLESAKEQVSEISKRTADLVRSDIYTLSKVYELIHEHVQKITGELQEITGRIEMNKAASPEEQLEFFREAERILVALITGCRFEIKAVEIGTETEQDKLLLEKRREIFDHLVSVLQKDT